MASAFNMDANDELWRECAQWLTSWEMIRSDHKVNLPDSKIVDFANILRDGVLLCKLLNKIDPGCIDMKSVNLKPTMAQFLCLRNISIFLQTCITSFSFNKSDLFEAAMLFDLTNFHKVLCALSKISLHPKSQRSNIRGFHAQKENTREEDEIYQSLQAEEMPARSRSVTEDYEEDIYQEILIHPLKRKAEEQPHSFEKRDYVINELLDTEKNYVDVLTKLKKNFMTPLRSHMKPEEHSIVFYKISELHEIHSGFNAELSQLRNPTFGSQTPKLSNIFLKYRDKFLVYGKYCANLQRATNLLQELCDNANSQSFNQAVLALEKEVNNGRFKLRDVLSVPMQRILKYHLLLEKLIENTSNNHEEYVPLQRTRETMLDVAGYINEVARDGDNLTVIKNVQESINDWHHSEEVNLRDYGRLLKDCDLRIKAHENQSKLHKNRYVFIFEKCIIICKQTAKGSFSFRSLLKLQDYRIDEIHNRTTLQRDVKMMYSFMLVKNDNSNALTICLRTLELKNSLIKTLRDALENLNPPIAKKTTHTLEYTTFETPTTCKYCSKYLKGLIFQGFRCSTCECGFHKHCIGNSIRCQGARGLSREDVSSISNDFNRIDIGGDDPLRDKLWFVGEMDRAVAESKLRKRESGTYLVRIRPQSEEKDKYALSLKTDTVKHMKIMCTEPSNDSMKYFLSQSKFFNSIEELIINYQHYSLKENFEKLADNTKLQWPFRQLQAVALRSFESDDDQELSLTEGSKVYIIGKEGYKDGWWRGYNERGEVGYFPRDDVRVEKEVIFE